MSNIFSRLLGRDSISTSYPSEGHLMFTSNPQNPQSIPIEWLRGELQVIRQGLHEIHNNVSNVRTEVSVLSQDVKNLADRSGRHETWLTKIEGDVKGLHGFPQKIMTVETDQKRLETLIERQNLKLSELENLKIDAPNIKRLETTIERQSSELLELKTFKTATESKNQGLLKFITTSAILVAMGSTLISGLFWFFLKIAT